MTCPSVFRTLGFGSALLWTIAWPLESARGQVLTTIATFNDDDGARVNNVTIDANGNLFGTTQIGGNYNDGTVWEIAKGSNIITTLASFNGSNGLQPFAGVTIDANGNLYGTTGGGGANNDGTVWEIAKGSNTITTLASFNGSNGLGPSAGVTIANGNLYGTTFGGGANGDGTVWEIAKGSSTITTLASFNGSNGANPQAGVTIDANGNFYGTTNNGGANGDGAVWEIAKGSSTITTLASFNYYNGATPIDNVTIAANGNLYSTAFYGGYGNNGTVWEIAKGSGTITTLASFNGANGANPQSGVTIGANGNLYGTTFLGGGYNNGTVWEMVAGDDLVSTLATFNGANGANPSGGVTLDDNGNLFGTTLIGGDGNEGTVWEIRATSAPEPSSIVTGLIGMVLAGGLALANRTRARRKDHVTIPTRSTP